MQKRFSILILCACMSLASRGSLACAEHFYIDTSEMGFFGGAVARMTGLAPPAPVFDIEHPAMLKATIGESSNFSFTYTKPFFAKNVSLELSGTTNMKMPTSIFLLEKRSGTIEIPFELTGSGFDAISLIIRGEHKGEQVLQKAQIYVRAKAKSTKPELQVSER